MTKPSINPTPTTKGRKHKGNTPLPLSKVGFLAVALTTMAQATHSLAENKPYNTNDTKPSVTTPSNRADWETENTYWRNAYPSRPYYKEGVDYNTYANAYHYGVDMYNRYGGKPYTELNMSELRTGWQNYQYRTSTDPEWRDAEPAVKDAYNRLYNNRNAGAKRSGDTQ